jgi:Cof subfamily protein (haloacid dehalogenase superfamily)
MPPRMLVLDLDGTLLTADRTIADVDLRAARALQDAGVIVTIATGRLFGGTRWVAEALGVTGPVAVMNGCELRDVGSREAMFGAYVTPELATDLHDLLHEHTLAPFLFESGGIHYGAHLPHLSSYLGIWTDSLVAHDSLRTTAPWASSREVVAVSACGPLDQVDAVRARITERIGAEHVAIRFQTFHGDGFLEIRRDEDKGKAIHRLAAHHGIDVEDVVTVGDWINDVPMLLAAGRSFAVAHAHREAVEAADEQLSAGREGGVVAELARTVWGL